VRRVERGVEPNTEATMKLKNGSKIKGGKQEADKK
jgi:hypothetical protein